MKVQQRQLPEDLRGLLNRLHQVGHGESELGVRHRAPIPARRDAARQPDARAQFRYLATFGRDGANHRKFPGALYHRDNLPAEALGINCQCQHRLVLHAVAHHKSRAVAQVGHRGRQLGPGAALQAHAEFAAGVQDFRDHVAQRIDLDRVQAAVAVGVPGPDDGGMKGLMQAGHLGAQKIRKPNHQRQFDSPAPSFPNKGGQTHGGEAAGV